MANSHFIKITIQFNEHDNEKETIDTIFQALENIKTEVEHGTKHEDIFFDVEMDSLKGYMTFIQRGKYFMFKGFKDWYSKK